MSGKGIAYGVGVGPGDPGLLTLKAVQIIRQNEIIAVPGRDPKESAAYRIAAGAVPEIAGKELVPVYMPMTRDREKLEAEHRKGADLLEQYLDQDRNVVYITLGDPTVYCSFSYLQQILETDGYTVELVPGVPSFCAAAARLNLPLVLGNEPLHVIPALKGTHYALEDPGTYVLMKSSGRMAEVKEILRASGRDISAVENCGMEGEKVYRDVDEIPDDTGYYSLLIAKEKQ